jgi:hypothetical protein
LEAPYSPLVTEGDLEARSSRLIQQWVATVLEVSMSVMNADRTQRHTHRLHQTSRVRAAAWRRSPLIFENVMLGVFEFNRRAIRAYEKAGFKEIGCRRQSYYFTDGWM